VFWLLYLSYLLVPSISCLYECNIHYHRSLQKFRMGNIIFSTTLKHNSKAVRYIYIYIYIKISQRFSSRHIVSRCRILRHTIMRSIIFIEIVRADALSVLLQFSTTYLCKQGFSALTNIDNIKLKIRRERFLSLDQELDVFVCDSILY
jgi:hypothetical protein